jgi:hypothetical protein
MSFKTIYVYLPDEAVDTWRPVLAEHVRENVYRIADQPHPEDEVWEFLPGTLVLCKQIQLDEGPVHAAIRAVEL